MATIRANSSKIPIFLHTLYANLWHASIPYKILSTRNKHKNLKKYTKRIHDKNYTATLIAILVRKHVCHKINK